jgi:hypothetical protein
LEAVISEIYAVGTDSVASRSDADGDSNGVSSSCCDGFSKCGISDGFYVTNGGDGTFNGVDLAAGDLTEGDTTPEVTGVSDGVSTS